MNTRKSICLITLICFCLIGLKQDVLAQNPYTIKGQLSKSLQGIIVLTRKQNNQQVADTAALKDGAFSFKGKVFEPGYAYFEVNPPKPGDERQQGLVRNGQEFFLDPAEISVKSNEGIETAIISGGKSQTDFLDVMGQLRAIGIKGEEISALMKKYEEDGNTEKLKEMQQEYVGLRKKRSDTQQAFIDSHPASFTAFELWQRKLLDVIDPAVIEPQFRRFSAEIRNSWTGKQIQERINKAIRLSEGKQAIDFNLNDMNGKPVTLASLKGKNVLLTLWKRNFFPFENFAFEINKISRQFKDENLVILLVYLPSIHIDKDWETIVKESGMTGANIINVKDVGFTEDLTALSQLAKDYDLFPGFSTQAYLIDTQGKILTRDVHLANDPVGYIKKVLQK